MQAADAVNQIKSKLPGLPSVYVCVCVRLCVRRRLLPQACTQAVCAEQAQPEGYQTGLRLTKGDACILSLATLKATCDVGVAMEPCRPVSIQLLHGFTASKEWQVRYSQHQIAAHWQAPSQRLLHSQALVQSGCHASRIITYVQGLLVHYSLGCMIQHVVQCPHP